MAYNSFFPTGYQPMQYNQPSHQNGGITWVQGEESAKSYLVAPNSTVTLWDTESRTIYVKSADASGMPSMRIFDYTERTENVVPKEAVNYVTKDDLEAFKKELKKELTKGEKK